MKRSRIAKLASMAALAGIATLGATFFVPAQATTSTDSRVLDIVAAALQTAALDDPWKDSGDMRPAIRLNEEESGHLARAAIHALESAGFVILMKDSL